MAKGNILAPVGLSSEAKLVKTDSRVLVCKLSKDEVLDKTRELGALIKQGAEVEARLEVAKSERKSLLERTAALSQEIGSHEATRAVTTEEWSDVGSGKVIVVRTDTGEVLSERLLKPSERQAEMPLL